MRTYKRADTIALGDIVLASHKSHRVYGVVTGINEGEFEVQIVLMDDWYDVVLEYVLTRKEYQLHHVRRLATVKHEAVRVRLTELSESIKRTLKD